MEDPPPSATWHPALRPETLDNASLYSPELDGPRQVMLSWDDVVARTPMRSRAPTHNLQQMQDALPPSIEEESDITKLEEELPESSAELPRQVAAEDIHKQESWPSEAVNTTTITEESGHAENPILASKSYEESTAPVIETPASPAQTKINGPVQDFDDQPSHQFDESVPPSAAESTNSRENQSNQSPSGHILPPDLSSITRQQDSNNAEIDAAWGDIGSVKYTNSFPPVPPSNTIQTIPLPLSHTQAGAVIAEEQKNHIDSSGHDLTTEYPWGATGNDFGDDGDFFSQPESQEQRPLTPPDDEARYEEGIPLVLQDSAEELKQPYGRGPGFEVTEDSTSTGDEFFSGLGNLRAADDHQPAALTRKSTEQVLNTMQFSQNTLPIVEEAEGRKKVETVSRSPAIVEDSSSEPIIDSALTAQADDKLAAMWEAALDDDMLDDAIDPGSFFGDEDDGFLLEGDSAPPSELASTVQPGQFNQQPMQNHAGQDYTNPTSYVPARFDMAAYQRSQSPFQTQPTKPAIVERAQSFADKSKGGYASPYDAPMDLSRPRRAPLARGPQILTRAGPAAAPPPRRSDSIQSAYNGTPTLPQLSPSTSNYGPPSNTYQTMTSSPQIASAPQRPASSGFFEELPVATKPRASASAARFTPQSAPHQFTPPPSSTPPQANMQPFAPRIASQSSQPPANQFGLVGPTKVMPFAEVSEPAPLSAAQPPGPSAVAGRYSPSISHQLGQQQPSQNSRFVPPNPYANATGIARPPSVPHQHTPNKPSPLARSSSANQYRPSDRAVEVPVVEGRQVLGMRRPSLLSHAQTLDELPSPQPPQQLNQLGIASNSYSPERIQSAPSHTRDEKGNHDLGRPLSHLPSYQEAATPTLIPTQSQAAPRSQLKLHNVESYSISQQAILTSANRVRAPSLLTGNDNFMPPNDPTVHDPLKRWQGAPIFRFGFGGTVVTSFPIRIPRYIQGSRTPFLKSNPGEIRISSSKVLPANERIATFPGPLKNKNKKKDILLWLHNGIASLTQAYAELVGQGIAAHAQRRHEEKIMLWKVLAILVECDGAVDGNPPALDAIRKVLSPEASNHTDQQSVTQPFLPAISGTDTISKPQAAEASTIDSLRQFLLSGEREKAVWFAVDQKLWGHAMLIASTMPRDLWKQVAHEFVRNEVKTVGRNTESLAALYDVFAGNWEESVDELVPPSARAGLTLMNKNSYGGSASSGLDGLDRWRETLNLVLSNRTAEDVKAIVAMGQLLTSYGRFEAAHICYIFAKAPGLFGGPDDPQSAVVLLGADHRQSPLDYATDTDSILLTEVFEFVQSVQSSAPSQAFALPHLQAFKLYHAELLAELGLKDEAQQYCDSITGALKATTNRSPYFHARFASAVDALGVRLRQSGKEGNNSWISRPNVDKVSGSFLKALSGFIAGDEDEASVASARADAEGPFARINGSTPETISRTSSPMVGGYGQHGPGQSYASAIPPTTIATNPRYAPGTTNATYAPQSTHLPGHSPLSNDVYGSFPEAPPNPYPSHQLQQATHIPQAIQTMAPLQNLSKYSPDITSQPQASPYYAPAHSGARMSSPSSDAESSRPGTGHEAHASSALLSPDLRSNLYQAVPPSTDSRYSPGPGYGPRSASLKPSSSSYELRSSTSQPRSYAPSPNLDPVNPRHIDSYEPSAPMYGEYPMGAIQSTDLDDHVATESPSEAKQAMGDGTGYMNQQSPGDHAPSHSSYEPPSAGYQPPSYGYEPPSYDPEATEEQDVQSPRKKKSIMDLDGEEDDLAARAAALKKSQKAAKDKEADDAFRLAAEEDAKKSAGSKANGGWLSGIWGRGGSKDTTLSKPKAQRIHEGEKNSYVFDKELNKWVNTKAGAESAGPSVAKPPPPKGPPKQTASVPPPGARPPTSYPTNGPPSASLTGALPSGSGTPPPPPMPSGPPSGLTLGLAPPSRPSTGMSGTSNASSIDDLMGPAQPRKGGTMKKGKKRAGYVDVLADKS